MYHYLSHSVGLATTLLPILDITIYCKWMIRPEDPIQYRCAVLHECVSGLVLTLSFKSIRQVCHARHHVGMLLSEHLPRRFHHLHHQLLRLLPSCLAPVCRCEIVHARQRVGMLRSEHLLTRLQLRKLGKVHIKVNDYDGDTTVPCGRLSPKPADSDKSGAVSSRISLLCPCSSTCHEAIYLQ